MVRASIVELEAFREGSFDHAACLFSTLGMVVGQDQRAEVVRHAWRLLRPGGTFVLHVLNTEPSQNRYYATVVPTAAVLGAMTLKRIFAGRAGEPDADPAEAGEPTGRHRPAVPAGTGTGAAP
jgi:SAM-dependent methyltransferase